MREREGGREEGASERASEGGERARTRLSPLGIGRLHPSSGFKFNRCPFLAKVKSSLNAKPLSRLILANLMIPKLKPVSPNIRFVPGDDEFPTGSESELS